MGGLKQSSTKQFSFQIHIKNTGNHTCPLIVQFSACPHEQ